MENGISQGIFSLATIGEIFLNDHWIDKYKKTGTYHHHTYHISGDKNFRPIFFNLSCRKNGETRIKCPIDQKYMYDAYGLADKRDIHKWQMNSPPILTFLA